MKGKNPLKKETLWKISNGFLVLALAGVFCLGHLIPISRSYESTPHQRFNSFGSCDLKDRLLGYFTPKPNYIFRSEGFLLNASHFAAISDSDYFLSRPLLARLIEFNQDRYRAVILADSTLKGRAPPFFPAR